MNDQGRRRAHVDETKAAWEYLDGADERFRPITLDPGTATVPNDRRPHRLGLIDGYPRLRLVACHAESR